MNILRLFCIFAAFVLVCVLAEGEKKIQHLSTGEAPVDFINNKLEAHDVMVFARTYGRHNHQAKSLLLQLAKETNTEVEFLDLDMMPGWDGSLLLLELEEITGQWALPNIFIGKNHIGGNNELDQIHALGELKEMVRTAGQDL